MGAQVEGGYQMDQRWVGQKYLSWAREVEGKKESLGRDGNLRVLLLQEARGAVDCPGQEWHEYNYWDIMAYCYWSRLLLQPRPTRVKVILFANRFFGATRSKSYLVVFSLILRFLFGQAGRHKGRSMSWLGVCNSQ
jgi:hypothetical protein